MATVNLTGKTRNELLQLAEKVAALKNRRKFRLLDFVFADEGKYSRAEYPKAMEFFKAGADHRFRMLAGGNGVGKSFNIGVELTYHITGEYPHWWEGYRQKNPRHWWIIVESADTWKASMQRLLLGNTLNDEDFGSGLIPKDRLVNTHAWSGVSGAIRAFEVRHKDGHIVTIEVKTSDQKRENLQAANLDGLLEDEEPPIDIHRECVFRLRGSPTKAPGILLVGFTPLKGATDVALSFIPNGQFPENGEHPDDPTKYVVRIGMHDVPHLSEEDKQMYMREAGPNELEARINGYIALGSGRIYPYAEDQVFVKPFNIPDYWPRCFSLDFGHHVTACLWGAKDPHTKIIYVYAEYYAKAHQTSQVHALNIKARGDWIKGICDPSGGGRQDDGRQLVDLFRQHGLDLTAGDNSMVGLTRNMNMFENGTLKIFDTLQETKREYRLYRFDSKHPNEPARNQDDHAMDCLKYLTSRFDWAASTEYDSEPRSSSYSSSRSGYDPLTGY